MANKRDYYEVLGINKNASESDIKSSFRKLSRQYHPDMQSGKSDAEKKSAEEKFKEIAEAYEVLSDKDKRANYDQFGFNGPQMQNGFGGFDMNDFMSRHASMFSGMFSHGFNPFGFGFDEDRQFAKSTPNPNSPEDGRNVQVNVKISFKEMISGCTKTFDLNISDPCPECNGTGVEKGSKVEKCQYCHGQGMITEKTQHGFMISMTTMPCPHCHGQGYSMKVCKRCNGQKRIPAKKHISVKIPQGISDGQRLRLKGMGECGVCGGQNGHLYANVIIENSNLFERNGVNVTIKMPISPLIAALGGTIDVPSPYGYCKVKIPKGTKTNDRIVVNGKGIKTDAIVGNLVVIVEIDTLTDLNSEQRKVLEDLQKSLTDKNLIQTEKMTAIAREFYS